MTFVGGRPAKLEEGAAGIDGIHGKVEPMAAAASAAAKLAASGAGYPYVAAAATGAAKGLQKSMTTLSSEVQNLGKAAKTAAKKLREAGGGH